MGYSGLGLTKFRAATTAFRSRQRSTGIPRPMSTRLLCPTNVTGFPLCGPVIVDVLVSEFISFPFRSSRCSFFYPLLSLSPTVHGEVFPLGANYLEGSVALVPRPSPRFVERGLQIGRFERDWQVTNPFGVTGFQRADELLQMQQLR